MKTCVLYKSLFHAYFPKSFRESITSYVYGKYNESYLPTDFFGCEMWSLTLTEHKPQVFYKKFAKANIWTKKKLIKYRMEDIV
jgi:hypothetical protein